MSFLGALVLAWILRTWVSRLTRRTRSTVDDAILKRLGRPVFLTIFFGGLHGAFALVIAHEVRLFSIVVALLQTIVLLGWLGFALSSFRFILHALGQSPGSGRYFESRTIPLYDNIGKVLFVVVAGYVACLIWGVDATALLTSAGIVGIALGFAAKDTLANLFSGIFILADTPYRIGDVISLDSGERGVVTQIGLRSTRILTISNIEVVIPNAVIANSKVVNESGGPDVRSGMSVKVGVAYGSDVDHVCAVLERVAAENPNVLKDPAPVARFESFGDSALNFALYAQIEDSTRRGLYIHELNMAIFKAFAAEGIEIPFPQRDVHLKQPAE
jgi:small-conductance mechanosensitive channel